MSWLLLLPLFSLFSTQCRDPIKMKVRSHSVFCSTFQGFSYHICVVLKRFQWPRRPFMLLFCIPLTSLISFYYRYHSYSRHSGHTCSLLFLQYSKRTASSGNVHLLFHLFRMFFTQTELYRCVHMTMAPLFLQTSVDFASSLSLDQLLREVFLGYAA